MGKLIRPLTEAISKSREFDPEFAALYAAILEKEQQRYMFPQDQHTTMALSLTPTQALTAVKNVSLLRNIVLKKGKAR